MEGGEATTSYQSIDSRGTKMRAAFLDARESEADRAASLARSLVMRIGNPS